MVPRGQNLRFRLYLAVILFAVGMAFLLAAILPTTRVRQVQQMPPVVLPTPTSLLLGIEEI
jgi:hypothetical protein